ncbi:MAG: Lpg1974 family pore-forming outer membrane protein [Planctomycetota bacterium]|nr:Lpg1974 family pore-forming outer membrane protein [Planctomycetota bacterium]
MHKWISLVTVCALLWSTAPAAQAENSTVPDVRGLSKEQALDILRGAELRVSKITHMPAATYRQLTGQTAQPGTIVQQSPAPGVPVMPGAARADQAVLLRMVVSDQPPADVVYDSEVIPAPPLPAPDGSENSFPAAAPVQPVVLPTTTVIYTPAPDATAAGVVTDGRRLQRRGWTIWAGPVFMKFRPTDTAFATEDPGVPFAPSGRVKRLEWDYDWGARGGVRYGPANQSWDVGLTAMWLEGEAKATANAPAGGSVGVLLYNANNAPPSVGGPATAEGSAELFQMDLTAGVSLDIGSSGAGRFFFGGRFATLEQSYDVLYDDSAVAANLYTRNAAMDLEAFGAIVGFESSFQVGAGFGFFGRIAGAMMVGQFKGTLRETQTTVGAGSVQQVDISERFERVVPVLEASVGVTWERNTGGRRRFRVLLGYEFQNWFNVLDVNQFPDDLADQNLTRNTTDLGLDGFILRLEATF